MGLVGMGLGVAPFDGGVDGTISRPTPPTTMHAHAEWYLQGFFYFLLTASALVRHRPRAISFCPSTHAPPLWRGRHTRPTIAAPRVVCRLSGRHHHPLTRHITATPSPSFLPPTPDGRTHGRSPHHAVAAPTPRPPPPPAWPKQSRSACSGAAAGGGCSVSHGPRPPQPPPPRPPVRRTGHVDMHIYIFMDSAERRGAPRRASTDPILAVSCRGALPHLWNVCPLREP